MRCYNEGRKKHFQSPFHFLISLFSWTPRDRLVNDPGALHLRRVAADSSYTAGLFSLLLLGTARYRYIWDVRSFYCGESPLTIRAQLVRSRYFPNPLGIVTLYNNKDGQDPTLLNL